MRDYGKVKGSLQQSRKWRRIETACGGDKAISRLAKNVYFYLLTSRIGNSIGAYVVPPEMAAVEMQEPADEIRIAYGALAEVGLIIYDPDEEMVLIVDFLEKNPITGVSHMLAAVRAVESLPHCHLRTVASVETVKAIIYRVGAWRSELRDRKQNARTDKQREAIDRLETNTASFLSEAVKIVREKEVRKEIEGLPTEVATVLSTELNLELPTVVFTETETQTEKETQTETQTQTQTQTETQTSPAAVASLDAEIRALNDRAGPRKRKGGK